MLRPEPPIYEKGFVNTSGANRHAGAQGSRPPTLSWQVEDGQGTFAVIAEGARALVGRAGARGAGMALAEPAFAAVTVTALDGRSLETARTILIAGCSRAENTGTVFADDRRTVGRHWGDPPVRIEPVGGSVALPPARWQGLALKPDGTAWYLRVVLARGTCAWYLRVVLARGTCSNANDMVVWVNPAATASGTTHPTD